MTRDQAAARLMRRQNGAISRKQLQTAGFTNWQVRNAIALGRLDQLERNVFVAGGVPASWELELRVALLACGDGALVSHTSAARLWGFVDASDDDWIETVHVSVAHGQPFPHRSIAHRTKKPVPGTRRSGFPVTRPARTLLDMGAVTWDVRDAVHRAVIQRLVSVSALQRELHETGRTGRPGTAAFRRAVAELTEQRVDSMLEVDFLRLVRRSGLPCPATQQVIRDSQGAFVARVDFWFKGTKVIVEVDGWAHHATPDALQRDLGRQNRLVALGYTVIRFTWSDVRHHPSHVVGTLRGVLSGENAA